MFEKDMGSQSKMQSLMELMKKMKELQAGSLRPDDKPHGVAVELESTGVEPLDSEDPELAKVEEATHSDLDQDQEVSEDPEHKALVLDEKAPEDEVAEEVAEEEPEEELSPLNLPPELLKLLQEHLASKK